MSEHDFIPFPAPSEAGSSKPAKAKGKDRVNSTLFISSLPYTATSTDLLTHFSYLGPVRHGFVTTDKESGKSKGVGYITYSLREDAEKAVEELDGKAFGDKGRKIRVQWADQRPGLKDRHAKAALTSTASPAPKAARSESAAGPSDPNAIRTIILTGLPGDITKNVLWKKVRKVDDRVELVYPVESDSGAAHLVFPTPHAAMVAVPKLHGHTYKGETISAVLKKRMDKISTQGGKASKAGRLIVRNLPWDATEADLRATFLPFGPLHSINLPTAPSTLPARNGVPHKPRARGFAFVWFLSRNDAERAIEGVNGKVITRSSGSTAKDEGKAERKVAVDWALSKEKWAEAQGEGEAAGDGVDAAEVQDDDEEESDDAAESSSDSDSDADSEEESDEELEHEDDESVNDEDEEGEEESAKPHLPDVDVGSTLFIRNLPYETEEQELNSLFRSFGPLRYARITIDKETGRSRGTGFVCFWKTEHADMAIAEAERVSRETGANAKPLGGKNPFALPSVLTADPSSSLASRLVIHGRTLDVSRAVTRERAGELKEDSERARNAGDKRNTYLMREGVIFPNSPAAAGLPAAEVEKRQSSFNARRALLRSNPSLYISKTRLSIRQLPLWVTDRTLKRLALHAIRTFNDEVKSEDREALTRAEENDTTLSAALGASKDKPKKKGKGERETPVIQSKVVRSKEKSDALLGLGRSRGYGFLELRTHKDALKVLRWANNNPSVGALMFGWWIGELTETLERTRKALEIARKAKGSDAKGESAEELENRIRRLEARIAENRGDGEREGGMRGGKTLMIEFSIENVQVVRRRAEKISDHRNSAEVRTTTQTPSDVASHGNGKRKATSTSVNEVSSRSQKRPKRSGAGTADKPTAGGADGTKIGSGDAASGAEREKRGLEKLGDQLGSLIGRKRKMRKGGK